MDAESAIEKPITTGEVARLIGVCKTTLLRWIRVGFLPEPHSWRSAGCEFACGARPTSMRALQHRESFYNCTRGQIDESKKRAKRVAGSGPAECNPRPPEAGAA